ncbi:MAG: type I methionyl aminopeptidase [Actinomycetota bacterium]|jgi:methionyl aminopeptidase|nr:type I methionyl aminopeptidase [Euzebyaceae bacterium]MDQ3451165.1 type I methionyl aminopeptidase [Actinomycetota bacterium]
MILRKSAAEVELMAKAGAVVARLHEVLRDAIHPGVSTADLDAVAEREVRNHRAVPSFKGYRGFPATLCTSVNHQIVHGIPSGDVVLQEGDLIKIDAGAILDGYHGDSAVTWVVGDESAADPAVLALVARTRAGLWAGLGQARAGNRLSDISAAVEAHALPHGYGVVREYVGHGIGRALHEDPHVPNYGRPGRGPKLVDGLVLAVEPMFNLGTAETEVLDDDWTVVTADGSLSSHWEHTVAVTSDGPWVLTARSDEPAWPLQSPELVPGAAIGYGAATALDERRAG